MPKVALYNMEGAQVGDIELSDAVFGVEMNGPLVHQVIKMQLANKRQGTQSALTRSEVRGGGIKPWRQKGTGRARQGSIRSPLWIKGGVVFAPKPRDYSYTMPKKMKQKALLCALSSKVAANEIIVVDDIALSDAKTKLMVGSLKKLNTNKKVLMVLDKKDETVLRASHNIPELQTAYVNTINVYDVLKYDTFVISKQAVAQVEEVYGK